MLHVFYKEKTGMRYRTDIRFGIEDFICKEFSFIANQIIEWEIEKRELQVLFVYFSRHGWTFGSRTWNEFYQCNRNSLLSVLSKDLFVVSIKLFISQRTWQSIPCNEASRTCFSYSSIQTKFFDLYKKRVNILSHSLPSCDINYPNTSTHQDHLDYFKC